MSQETVHLGGKHYPERWQDERDEDDDELPERDDDDPPPANTFHISRH